jgi:hypothetical protein
MSCRAPRCNECPDQTVRVSGAKAAIKLLNDVDFEALKKNMEYELREAARSTIGTFAPSIQKECLRNLENPVAGANLAPSRCETF